MNEAIELNALTPRKRKLKNDLSGQKIGRWTVVKFVGMNRSIPVWECVCECGRTKNVLGHNLVKSGKSLSCGCLRSEGTSKRMKTHGATNSPEFRSWQALRNRCENPKNKDYKDYGGRGVAVSKLWVDGNGEKGGFECFLESVGKKPTAKHSIDRWPDKNGHYEPGNVRWATWKEQQNNRRSNHLIEIDGETKTLSQWGEHYGVEAVSAWYRINAGWEPKRAFTQPFRQRKRICS